MNTVNVSYCGRETAGRGTVPGAKGIHHFVESLRASPTSPLYASVYRYLSMSESDRLRLPLHIQTFKKTSVARPVATCIRSSGHDTSWDTLDRGKGGDTNKHKHVCTAQGADTQVRCALDGPGCWNRMKP